MATARAAFAALVGTRPEHVAIGATVSQLVGLVAASLPGGSRVLLAEGDFTSVGFPFAAQRERDVRVDEVPLEHLAEHAAGYDLVAVSAVQSSDGRRVDLAALRAAHRSGTRVLLDVTQAAGWMPLALDWADWVVGAGYKWLLAPRGAAWLAVHPEAPTLLPHSWIGAALMLLSSRTLTPSLSAVSANAVEPMVMMPRAVAPAAPATRVAIRTFFVPLVELLAGRYPTSESPTDSRAGRAPASRTRWVLRRLVWAT